MTRSIAALAALGVLFAALPFDAAMAQQQVSPVYAGKAPRGTVIQKATKPPKDTIGTPVAAKPKAAKVRSTAQKQAQRKATKAAAAKMKRSGPSVKQKAVQRKATRASAAKARAKPNKPRR